MYTRTSPEAMSASLSATSRSNAALCDGTVSVMVGCVTKCPRLTLLVCFLFVSHSTSHCSKRHDSIAYCSVNHCSVNQIHNPLSHMHQPTQSTWATTTSPWNKTHTLFLKTLSTYLLAGGTVRPRCIPCCTPARHAAELAGPLGRAVPPILCRALTTVSPGISSSTIRCLVARVRFHNR